MTSTSTATSSTQNAGDSELLKLLEITKIQRDAAVEKNKLYEDRLAAKDTVIEAQKGLIDVRDQQLALAKKIDVNSQQINTVEKEQIRACEQQLAKADARIWQLEHPGLLRELFSPKEVLKMGGAFLIGRATAPK